MGIVVLKESYAIPILIDVLLMSLIIFKMMEYLDGNLLCCKLKSVSESSFSSKVGKCLGVQTNSSSNSSSSSDQPPAKTESSLSSRIRPRLRSSLKSSGKEIISFENIFVLNL